MSTHSPETDLDAHFGVFIENEMDEIRFAYLLKVLGPEKLWRAVAVYRRRWPDSKPFVSSLLKRYNIKVPAHLYAPKQPGRPSVYLLVCADWSVFKVGFSERWRQRVLAFSHTPDLDAFDPDLTGAVYFADSAAARQCERAIKDATRNSVVEPPSFVPYGAYGHGEWRAIAAYEKAREILHSSASCASQSFESLQIAME